MAKSGEEDNSKGEKTTLSETSTHIGLFERVREVAKKSNLHWHAWIKKVLADTCDNEEKKNRHEWYNVLRNFNGQSRALFLEHRKWGTSKTNWLFDAIPFDPYQFAKLPLRGNSTFLQKDGWSVIGFNGSPKDRRNGTVSVFFTKRIIDFDVFLREILSHDCAQEIINKLNEQSK